MKEKIYSPISGQIIPIENVNDPVFAEKMLGDGIAVKPSLGVHKILAPCDGVVSTLQDTHHAIVITSENGCEVLIHVGIDTVGLKGQGFKPFVGVDSKIKKGDVLLEVDFSLIASNNLEIDVIVLFTNLDEGSKLEKASGNIAAGEELVLVLPSDSSESIVSTKSEGVSGDCVSSGMLTVINPTGIHARPASAIFQAASKYSSDVKVKKGDKSVNAKSVVAILSLGVKFQEQIEIIATGADASEAVADLKQQVEDGLGEGNSHAVKPATKPQSKPRVAQKTDVVLKDGDTIKGSVACPGIVIGKAFILEEEEIEVVDSPAGSSDKQELHAALNKVKQALNAEISKAKQEKQTTKMEIFSAHLTMLSDPGLVEEADRLIDAGKNAAFSWKNSIKQSIDALRSTGNQLLIERIADLKDLERRVLKVVLEIEDASSYSYPENTVIVAKDLIPSDLSKFDDNVKGVILSMGSTTAHVSLMLRNMGIPSVVAVGYVGLQIKDKMNLVLDADVGTVLINPTDSVMLELKAKKEASDIKRAENIRNCKLPAVTKDGLSIKVKGNVGNPAEAKRASELGAEGVGLLRTEFLFFNSSEEPTEEEQISVYQSVLDALEGNVVTIRTLDVGGDKPLSFVEIDHEENPIMGMRGVRNYFTNMDVFTTQIRAILKIKPLVLVKIMIPMISNISEVIEVRKIIESEKQKLGVDTQVEIGIMIEVPSAALLASQLSHYVDFFSIGTNDLAQYTLAMDRGNSNLTHNLKNLHPAILKLIKMTVDGGNVNSISTAVCGAMASEIVAIPILIGLGVKELSTSMKSVPDVRALVREVSYDKCKEVADKALLLDSAESVLKLVKSEFNL